MKKVKIRILSLIGLVLAASGCQSQVNNADLMLRNDQIPFSNGPNEEPKIIGPDTPPPVGGEKVLESGSEVKDSVKETSVNNETPRAMTEKEDIKITLPEAN